MKRRGHRPSTGIGNRPRFWGRHAVTAALANPERVVRKVWGTREGLASLDLPPVLLSDDALMVAPLLDAVILVVNER